MQPELFQSFIDSISTLTREQLGILDSSLPSIRIKIEEVSVDSESETAPNGNDVISDVEKSILTEFDKHPKCPACKGFHISRWGIRNGRQRYYCKPCESTFNAFSGTPLARLRHPDKWDNYLSGMTHSLTLRPAATENEIDLKTSFRWRHRFLEVIKDDQAEELSGITELDETFLRESFKGRRKDMPRPSRKRASDPVKARKIPIMVARDRNKNTVDGVLENESATELCRHLNGRISIQATVCADAHLAHEKLADMLGFEFKELVTSAGQHVIEGIYHIQHVNSYHSHFKRWIGGVFHGVATEYLPHYLAWRRDLTGAVKLTTDRLINRITEHWCHQPVKGT